MPDTVRVITNHHRRDVVDAWELTPAERTVFDYLDWPAIEDGRDSASFVRYRGELHDLAEFTRWESTPSPALRTWDGYRSDSFYSALVVRYADSAGESVIIGLALS